jgi:3-phytase
MKTITAYLGWSCAVLSFVVAQSASITLTPAATGFEGDNTGFVYGVSPLLVSNDGSAAKGGFRAFSVANKTPFTETTHAKTGRSKVAVPVHDIGGRNIISTSLPQIHCSELLRLRVVRR